MITVGTLVAAGLAPTQARAMLAPLVSTFARFHIDTPARQGAFVGQCRIESGDFTRFEENLFYRTPERIRAMFPTHVTSLQQAALLVGKPEALANCVYAGRLGNGNPLTGEGWLYRGRGVFQLTGKANYRDAETELGRPYMKQPELVAQPDDACLTAGWYWNSRKLSLLADVSAVDEITRAINGPAMVERSLRRQYTDEATRAFA